VTDVHIAEGRIQPAQRIARNAPRRRLTGVDAFFAGVDDRIAAVRSEYAVLVADESIERIAVYHPASRTTRRKQCGRRRSVRKVQILGAGVLVERERHFELPVPELRFLQLGDVEVHIAPGVVWQPEVVGRVELPINFERDRVQNLSVEADTMPRNVELVDLLF